jgi:hypothetical protein
MANYKETTGTATAWRRSHQVLIKNPLNGQKQIQFFEEDVFSVGDRIINTSAGLISQNYDSSSNIVLRDPQTGEPTGNTIPQALVYQALYSLYIDAAQKRDIEVAAELERAVQAQQQN